MEHTSAFDHVRTRSAMKILDGVVALTAVMSESPHGVKLKSIERSR
jgi:hypothetical protein